MENMRKKKKGKKGFLSELIKIRSTGLAAIAAEQNQTLPDDPEMLSQGTINQPGEIDSPQKFCMM
jgi:hypothetical protein